MRTRAFFLRGRAGWIPVALASAAGFLSLVGQGCVLARQGPALDQFEPAHRPNGATAMLDTPWGHVNAELLEVTDTGLLVLEGDGVSELRGHQIDVASFVDVRVRWNRR